MHKMTMSGSIVEGIENPADEFKNVVTGKILKIEKHPDADKLVVCQVDVGEDAPIQIVTGAKNVFEGAVVPVAKHKSCLPGGVKITFAGDFSIQTYDGSGESRDDNQITI